MIVSWSLTGPVIVTAKHNFLLYRKIEFPPIFFKNFFCMSYAPESDLEGTKAFTKLTTLGEKMVFLV